MRHQREPGDLSRLNISVSVIGPGGNNNVRNEVAIASNILEETLETVPGGIWGRVCEPAVDYS